MSNIQKFPGTSDPELDRWGRELTKLIDQTRGKKITFAAIIGTLHLEAHKLLVEMTEGKYYEE